MHTSSKFTPMAIFGLLVATLATAAGIAAAGKSEQPPPSLERLAKSANQNLTRNFRYVCPTSPKGSYTQLWSQLQQ